MKVTKPLLVGGLLVGLVAPAAAFTLPLIDLRRRLSNRMTIGKRSPKCALRRLLDEFIRARLGSEFRFNLI